MPHLTRHGTSAHKSHLRGPVTLAPIAERLAVELSLPGRRWDLNIQPSAPTDCAITAACKF